MTRHRRGDTDGIDGEEPPWRAHGYDRPPRQPDPAGEYYPPPPWGEQANGSSQPVRGAVGTSSGWGDDPGAETGPPWELPGWHDPAPGRRAPGTGGLDGGHPSGPLPQVPPGPLPPVPGSWPAAASGDTRRQAAHSGDPDDRGYLRTGYTDPGYGDGRDTGPGYLDTGYAGPHRSDPGFGGAGRYPDEDYATGDYARDDLEPRAYAEQGYHREPAYRPGDDYPDGADYGHGGYSPEDYAGDRGYPRHAGYPGGEETGYPEDQETGYPGDQETGYPGGDEPRFLHHHGDDYAGEGEYSGHRGDYQRDGSDPGTRDPDDDRGYGDPGGWYGEVAEDQGWADDEYDDGFLPGLSSDTDSARPGTPGRDDTSRAGAGATRPRKAKNKRKSGIRRAAPWIALTVLVAALAVVGGVGFYVYRTYFHPANYSGPGTGSVTVHITSGESATQVGQQLLQLGVVASVRAFSNAAKASGHGDALEPGYYRLHKHMNATLAFALLLKPSSRIQLTILVPGGLRLYETIGLLGKDTGNLHGYEQAIKDTSALGLPSYAKGNPEGYLYPDTYTALPGTSPAGVLRQMTQAFDREADAVDLTKWAAHDNVTPGQIVTIASIIQAEGKRPQDLPKIARVIYNRLNMGMKLQLDTTVLYALHSRNPDVTIAQTHVKSPYNTYLHAGLPPGPIDSPGPAAIKAALHPAKGNWLYFVAVNLRTGLTKFTNSYSQFQVYENELNTYLARHH
jgi:uncharacterized YceG family protein